MKNTHLTETEFRVFTQHAITHKYIEYCSFATKKFAMEQAKDLHTLGLSGEVQEKTGLGWMKIKEFHGNEDF